MRIYQTARRLLFRPVGMTLIWLYFTLFGCATSLNAKAIQVERGLEAGSLIMDGITDAAIAHCRALELPVAQRPACTAQAELEIELVDEVLVDAVGVLRVYWAAVSANDEAGARRALLELRVLIDQLPPKHFGGLQALLGAVR